MMASLREPKPISILPLPLLNKLIYPLAVLLLLVSCERDDDPAVILPAKTVLVYMVADNNLSSDAETNLDSLLAGVARYGTDGNLLVYLDNAQGLPQLFRFSRSSPGMASSETVKTYAEQNSVSPTVMASVLANMTTLYPAQSYGLVLWSHGYGWLPGPGNTKTIATRWFGQDGANYMDIADLAEALATAPKFDYILFDACFMAGVEVACELRDYADYLVASPAEVLAQGFPYSMLTPYLFGSGETNSIQLASTYFNWYNGQTGKLRSAAVSCVKLSEMENLATATRALFSVSLPALNAFDASQVQYLDSYSPHLFYDFAHFTSTFAATPEYAGLATQLERTVIYYACTPAITTVNAQGSVSLITPVSFGGIGCYIPQQENASRNSSFQLSAWYTAAGWEFSNW